MNDLSTILSAVFTLSVFIGCGAEVSSTMPDSNSNSQASADMTNIPVIYSEENILADGKEGDRVITYDQFYDVRYDVVDISGDYGTTSPDGHNADDDCVYFIVDDWHNDFQRNILLEICKSSGLTQSWISDLMSRLHKHPGWRVGVGGLGEGYAVIFADKILVTGDRFRDCSTFDQFMKIASLGLRIQDLMVNCNDSKLERLSKIATHRDTLKIGESEITDGGLAYLEAFPKLQLLELHETKITNNGLSNFRHISRTT